MRVMKASPVEDSDTLQGVCFYAEATYPLIEA